MQIREGAYYRTRGGDVVGPMKRKTFMSHDDQCPFFFWDLVYQPQGQYREGFEPKYDLISEVYVSDTPPADAPETKTLRDEFADTALKAMLGNSDYVEHSPAQMAVEAYRQASAMMEARKK